MLYTLIKAVCICCSEGYDLVAKPYTEDNRKENAVKKLSNIGNQPQKLQDYYNEN